MSRPPRVKRVGLKPINSKMKRPVYSHREKDGTQKYNMRPFSLEEHLSSRRDAVVAQLEWACEGYLCHIETVDEAGVYYIWVGPKRKTQVRLLPGESIKRSKRRSLRLA